jgi:hypothetical protein
MTLGTGSCPAQVFFRVIVAMMLTVVGNSMPVSVPFSFPFSFLSIDNLVKNFFFFALRTTVGQIHYK